jgi:glutathione S-transferase
LGESAAILQYLAESRNVTHYNPQDAKTKAQINSFLHWNHLNSRSSTKRVLVTSLFPPKIEPLEALKNGVKEFKRSVDFIESHLSTSSSKFLVGDTPTLADLTIITEFDQISPEAFNLFDYSGHPNVTKWMNNCKLGIASYDEIFQPVKEIAQKYKKTSV